MNKRLQKVRMMTMLMLMALFSSLAMAQTFMELRGIDFGSDECVSGISKSGVLNGSISIGYNDGYQMYFWSKDQNGNTIPAFVTTPPALPFTTNGTIGFSLNPSSALVNIFPTDIVEFDEINNLYAVTGYIEIGAAVAPKTVDDWDIFVFIVKENGEILVSKRFDNNNNDDRAKAITCGKTSATGFKDLFITGSSKSNTNVQDLMVSKLVYSNIPAPNLTLVWDKLFDINFINNLPNPYSGTYMEEGLDVIYNLNLDKLIVGGRSLNIYTNVSSGFLLDILEFNGVQNISSFNLHFENNGTFPGNWIKKVDFDLTDNLIALGKERNLSGTHDDAFVLKIDNTGALLWLNKIDHNGLDDNFNSFLTVKNNPNNNGNIHIIGDIELSGDKQIRVLNFDDNLNVLPAVGHFYIGNNNYSDYGIDISESKSGNGFVFHGHTIDPINHIMSTPYLNLLIFNSNYDLSDIACNSYRNDDLLITLIDPIVHNLEWGSKGPQLKSNPLFYQTFNYSEHNYCQNYDNNLQNNNSKVVEDKLHIEYKIKSDGNLDQKIYFHENQEEILNIQIFTSLGVKVFSKDIENLKELFVSELINLEEGIYIIQVKTKSQIYYEKILVRK